MWICLFSFNSKCITLLVTDKLGQINQNITEKGYQTTSPQIRTNNGVQIIGFDHVQSDHESVKKTNFFLL